MSLKQEVVLKSYFSLTFKNFDKGSSTTLEINPSKNKSFKKVKHNEFLGKRIKDLFDLVAFFS